MDEVIEKRFERVEKALATLITSISTHNPVTSFATDLVAADAELSEGLEQLTVHQSNYAKIASLRATSAELDTQIRDTLILLTKTRSELIATPATNVSATTNPLSYSELLSFARRISKYTLPPSHREPDPEAAAASTDATNLLKDGQVQANGTGSTTPIQPMNGADVQTQTTAMDIDSTVASAEATQTTEASVVKTNTKNWSIFLGPRDDAGWMPWPSSDAIRNGALANIQYLLDQGFDPSTFDPEKSAELEAERKRVMEEEDIKREEEQTRMDDVRRKEMERRMSDGSGARPERVQEQPKVFQLETFDDDDDDD